MPIARMPLSRAPGRHTTRVRGRPRRSFRPAGRGLLDLDTQQVSHCDANCERMRCEVFLEQGQCVGSGVVEAGCMTVVRNRCIRSGMH